MCRLCSQIREGGVEANRDWGTYLLDDGSGPDRNWLVEHLDGHDVLTIRKCKWAAARSASEQAEVEDSVAVGHQQTGPIVSVGPP